MNIYDVQESAVHSLTKMREAGFPDDLRPMATLCMAEEVGEAVQAARRYMGLARKAGTLDALRDELADVVISTAHVAEVFGIDLDAAVSARLDVVTSRPYRAEPADDRPARSPGGQH